MSVLEHNLRRLLQQSYVPALPAPHFRDRLAALFLSELERRAAPHSAAPHSAAPRSLLLLAASLLAILLGWRLLTPASPPTGPDLVARGSVALGFPDGSWRAAEAEELRQGHVFVPPTLRALTPASLALEILAADGRVHLAERSALELARAGETTTATLQSGAAWFARDGQRLELVPGRRADLEAATTAREAAPTLAAVPASPAREVQPSVPAPEPTPVAAAERVFAGHVVAADGGAPIRAFTVALLGERRGYQMFAPVRRRFTDGDGFFTWPDPPRGKQRVFVHAEGYALCALGEHDFSGAPPELLVELEAGVRVRGHVLDAAGNPVADALVLAEAEVPLDGLPFDPSQRSTWLPIQARSGSDGRFELAHLAPGVHVLRASAAGFATAWLDGVPAPSPAGDEPVLVLDRGGAIAGEVQRDDGGPWAGAEMVAVAMDEAQRPLQVFALTRTDADGRYRFEHLPPLTLLVVRMRADELPDVRPVQVGEGQTARVDFLAPRGGIRLHGRLLDRQGQPLAHRNLGLFDYETASWNQDWVASSTDAGGAYVFEGVEPGRYALYLVDEPGQGIRCVDELELPPGLPELEHDLVVPAGRLVVVVRSAATGAPVARSALMVTRHEADGRETFAAFGKTDAEGRHTFVEQRPGRYSVVAYPEEPGLGFALGPVVEITEQRAAELELLHEAGGAVAVRVRALDGRALEGAAVVFHDEHGVEHLFSRVPRSDASGRYLAQGLRPGRYRLTASREGFQEASVSFELRLGHTPEIPVLLAPLPTTPDKP